MKRLITVSVLFVAVFFTAGSGNRESGAYGEPSVTNLLSFERAIQEGDDMRQYVSSADIMRVDLNESRRLSANPPATLEIDIPHSTRSIRLELARSFPLSDDFTLREKNGADKTINYRHDGIHYSGRIVNKPGSMATLSIFENYVMGMISDERGNFVLGPAGGMNSQPGCEHVFYNDGYLVANPDFHCGIDGREEMFTMPVKNGISSSMQNDNPQRLPVNVYFEADYQMYLDGGGNIQNVVNFITGFFNSVQTIYQAEGIPTQVNSISVWTAADPYRNLNESDTILFAFGSSTRDNFQGNLAHLISTRSNGFGGIAWIRVLCAEYEPSIFAGRFAFSNIDGTYNNFPAYSWTVNVVTHEMGHNLGSRHTHSCSWPINGQIRAIDSCYFSEGGCFATPRPRVGTIMSYCHLWPANQGGGVNLSLGFGPLPGDTIRLRYSQASCLDRVMNSSERPVAFDLAQNHPNPFNPSTVIRFAVPEASALTLSIYDVSGRKIAEIVSRKLYEPGFHEVKFDASKFGLASGIYLYRLSGGGFAQTRRMALVK